MVDIGGIEFKPGVPDEYKPIKTGKEPVVQSYADLGKGSLSIRGGFYGKGTVDLMKQAVGNLVGQEEIVIEENPAKLWDGTPNTDPERLVGVRIINETNPGNLSGFWGEVGKLQAEAEIREKSSSQ